MNTYERLVLRLLLAILQLAYSLLYGGPVTSAYREISAEAEEFLAKTPKM